ncbi:caveolin-2 isoform X1 [Petromyzon marinus]|uniref:caveolin-2 isoform X1 n=1 Tax=Petromyzon marinus TaxID=7757 RepID=UPI003F6EF09B
MLAVPTRSARLHALRVSVGRESHMPFALAAMMDEAGPKETEIGVESSEDLQYSGDGCLEEPVKTRDPKNVNEHLKISFEDVIAEPRDLHSFDKVWVWSDALYEVARIWSYRVVSLLFAVPLAVISALVFAVLSCVHIWCVMPCVRTCLICMPNVRTLWASVVNTLVMPLCDSAGRCCSSVYVHVARE